MFTGIITDIGTVRSAEERGGLRLEIACGYDMAGVDLGASIACSGVCLTVVAKGPEDNGGWFAVDVSGETRARTTAGTWGEGTRLNLERALRLGDELGGHLVTGHVDCIGEVIGTCPDGDSTRLGVRVPADIGRFLAPKGSVTLDGVSLTVNEVQDADDGAHFAVNVIPHSASVTTLGALAAGSRVNVEIDVIARYLDRLSANRM